MNCENTRTLCPSSTTSASWGKSMSSLALGSPICARVDQARDGRPPDGAAAERFEHFDLRAVQLGGVLAQRGLAVVGPQLFVELALVGFHVAVERLLGLLGKVLHDLRLGAPEDERPERLGQERAVRSTLGARPRRTS